MVTEMQSNIDHYQNNNKQLRQQIKEAQIDLGITSEHELKAKKTNVRRDVPTGDDDKDKESGADKLNEKQKKIDVERDRQSQKILQYDQLKEWIDRFSNKL